MNKFTLLSGKVFKQCLKNDKQQCRFKSDCSLESLIWVDTAYSNPICNLQIIFGITYY